jgi:excisionase family DNA binding protein
MRSSKTVFTTGEAAKICKVSQQTIIRCFDSGQLKGFRVPGSRFRRIPRETLRVFMKENGIPTDALESGKREVLLVDDDVDLVEVMATALKDDGRFEVRIANNGFDAGMMVKEYRPDVIVLDVMLPDINGREVCQRVRSDKQLEDVRIICISGMIEPDKVDDLKQAGADDFLQKPFDVDALIERICVQLEMETVRA